MMHECVRNKVQKVKKLKICLIISILRTLLEKRKSKNLFGKLIFNLKKNKIETFFNIYFTLYNYSLLISFQK